MQASTNRDPDTAAAPEADEVMRRIEDAVDRVKDKIVEAMQVEAER